MDLYQKCFTTNRLKRYSANSKNEAETLDNYWWNILLSKEIYSIIALFEVSFRNSIALSINKNIHKNWICDKFYIENLLDKKSFPFYLKAYEKLKNNGKLTEGKLIAELNLGFWINLFNKKYRVRLWNNKKIFEDIFPFYNQFLPDRLNYIYPKLKEIQKIRNRISHHEAIFDYKYGLNNFYSDLLECLSWVDPELKSKALQISSFEEIWNKKPSFAN